MKLTSRITRLITATVTTVIVGMAISTPVSHATTYYNAELQQGWAEPTSSSTGALSLGSNGVWTLKNTTSSGTSATLSWLAPYGMTFDGFAYTAANFQGTAVKSPVEGALSGGIWAYSPSFSGGSGAKAAIVLPWTDDCSVWQQLANSAKGTPVTMWWTHIAKVAESTQYASCSTSGNTTGWNYVNVQQAYVGTSTGALSTAQDQWSQLELRVACDAAECDASTAAPLTAEAKVDNLSAVIADTYNAPSETLLYWAKSSASSAGWYTTRNSGPTLAFNALDSSGVCDLRVNLVGSDGGVSTSSDDLVTPPVTTNPGDEIGEEYASTVSSGQDNAPCDTSENYGWTLPASLASGNYTVNVEAANAGQYAGGGYSSAGDTNITTAPITIQVDNTVPTITVTNVTPSSASAQLTVAAGPSGLQGGAPSCTQYGTAVTPTLNSGNSDGIGTTFWTVVGTGSLAGLSCDATNNDQNGRLSSGTVTMPAVIYVDGSNTAPGSWNGPGSQTVAVSVPTGDELSGCELNGTALGTTGANTFTLTSSSGSTGQAVISSPGENSLVCVTQGESTGSAVPYEVWITAPTPSASWTQPAQGNNPDLVDVTMANTGWLLSTSASLVNQQTGASLPAKLTDSGGIYSFTVNDGGLVAGAYTLTGTATAIYSTDDTQTFTIGTLNLPLRQWSDLTLSAAGATGTQLPTTPTTIAGLQNSNIVRLTTAAAKLHSNVIRAHSLTLPWGKTVTLTGTLTNSATGVPIAGQTINIYQQVVGQSAITKVGSAATNGSGDWSMNLSYGPSRTIYASWAGTATSRSATTALSEISAAKVTITAGTARAKHKFVISGQVLGGYIPSGGLEVTVYFQQVGRSKSYVLVNATCNSKGNWSYHFTPPLGDKGMTFRYWAQVKATAGWPYTGARSATITRKVLAP